MSGIVHSSCVVALAAPPPTFPSIATCTGGIGDGRLTLIADRSDDLVLAQIAAAEIQVVYETPRNGSHALAAAIFWSNWKAQAVRDRLEASACPSARSPPQPPAP